MSSLSTNNPSVEKLNLGDETQPIRGKIALYESPDEPQ